MGSKYLSGSPEPVHNQFQVLVGYFMNFLDNMVWKTASGLRSKTDSNIAWHLAI